MHVHRSSIPSLWIDLISDHSLIPFFPFAPIHLLRHPGVCGEPQVDPYTVSRSSRLCLRHSADPFRRPKASEPYLTVECEMCFGRYIAIRMFTEF